MKKFIRYAYCALLVGALASCGGSSDKDSDKLDEDAELQEYALTPKTTSITGPLGKAYEVVEREYKVKGEYVPEISVEVTLANSSGLPSGYNPAKVGTRFDEGKAQYPMIANFTIEFLDEDGDVIQSGTPHSGYGDVLRLSQGESSTLKFFVPDDLSDVKYFRIKSDYYPNEIEGKVSESAAADVLSTNDEDLDKTLEQAGKMVETAGKMIETGTEVMKGLNNLTK